MSENSYYSVISLLDRTRQFTWNSWTELLWKNGIFFPTDDIFMAYRIMGFGSNMLYYVKLKGKMIPLYFQNCMKKTILYSNYCFVLWTDLRWNTARRVLVLDWKAKLIYCCIFEIVRKVFFYTRTNVSCCDYTYVEIKRGLRWRLRFIFRVLIHMLYYFFFSLHRLLSRKKPWMKKKGEVKLRAR